MTDKRNGRAWRPFGDGARLAAAAMIGTLLPIAATTAASAGDYAAGWGTLSAPTAPTAHGARWDTYFAGITLGQGFHGRDRVGLVPPDPAAELGTLRASGLLLGVQLGASWQHRDIVLGIEGALNQTRIRDSFTNAEDQTASTRINPVAELRGRVGVARGDTLYYAAGGLTAGRVRYAVSGPGPDSLPDPVDISARYNSLGWNIGVGMEHALDHHWSVRGEYGFTRFPGRDLSDGTYTTRATPRFHSLRVGINRSF